MCIIDIGFDFFGNVQSILIAHAINLDRHGGFCIQLGRLICFRKPVDNCGDIAQAKMRAIGTGAQDERFKFFAAICLPFGAQQDFTALCANGTAGQINREAPYGHGNFAKGEVVTPQVIFRDFDSDFVGTCAYEIYLCDAGNGCNVVSNLLANCFESFFICRSRDSNVDDLAAIGDFSNDGFFRFHWKRGDGIYAGFDIVEQFAHISTRLEFDVDNTAVLRCCGGDALNAVETQHGFFDAYADGFFDFFGSSTQIDHGDIDHVL